MGYDLFADDGGEPESTPTADTPAPDAPAAEVPVDSPTDAGQQASTAEETPRDEAGQEAPAVSDKPDQPDQPDKPQEEPGKPLTDEEKAEAEQEKIEQEAESALADPKAPKWFKHVVNDVYKPKIEALAKQVGEYEPLTQYGSVQEISEKLELLQDLESTRFDAASGQPVRSTEAFVQALHKRDPEVTHQLLNDLASLPSPNTPGLTIMQDVFKQATGIDPNKLADVQRFAANGYQLQTGATAPPDPEDLAQIPEHLREAFSSLDPQRRDALMIDDEAIRNANLEDIKIAQDAKRTREEQEATRNKTEQEQADQQRQQFVAEVETKAGEHFEKSGEAVFTTFVDSLAKQADLNEVDALGIANTVLNSFEPTLAGRQSQAMLKKMGIEPDPGIQDLISKMEENTKFIAFYEKTGDKANLKTFVDKQVEFQERLIAKGNRIIAAVAAKKAGAVAQTIKTQNSKLDITEKQTQRFAPSGTGGNPSAPRTQVDDDFSDEKYLELLTASGGINGRG
jgi:hypothetical protein